MRFAPRIGGDGLKFIVGDGARAAPFHLLKEALAFHRTHEKQDFQGFDVGSGRDHVHGHGDARVVAVAEGCDQIFGFGAGCLVGNLLGKLVAFAKLFAHDLHNFVGMAIVLGEDQGFGYFSAPGKEIAEEGVFEGTDHRAHLVGCYDIPV